MSFAQIISDAFNSAACIAGVKVKYRRGEHWVELQAIPGRTVDDGSGVLDITVLWQTRDFIVSSCDLVLNGEAISPERGDIIEEVVSGNMFDVAPIDGGDTLWRYSDSAYRTSIRIHTRARAE